MASEMDAARFGRSAFGAVKGRYIILAVLIALLFPTIVSKAFWQASSDDVARLTDSLASMASYVLLTGLLALCAFMKDKPFKVSPVKIPPWQVVLRHASYAIPLIATSMLTLYVLFYPLSHAWPQLIETGPLNMPKFFVWQSDPAALLSNSVNVLTLVVLAPIVEEVAFRGFLLNRWIVKYGALKAIIYSSIAFAVLHVGLLGMMIFSAVLSVVYLRTNSLIYPIIVHIANNMLVVMWMAAGAASQDGPTSLTAAQFQATWWLGALGGMISVPWLVWFWRTQAKAVLKLQRN